ncbi:MAG: hypothetical protein V1853_03175 [bacterium]
MNIPALVQAVQQGFEGLSTTLLCDREFNRRPNRTLLVVLDISGLELTVSLRTKLLLPDSIQIPQGTDTESEGVMDTFQDQVDHHLKNVTQKLSIDAGKLTEGLKNVNNSKGFGGLLMNIHVAASAPDISYEGATDDEFRLNEIFPDTFTEMWEAGQIPAETEEVKAEK